MSDETSSYDQWRNDQIAKSQPGKPEPEAKPEPAEPKTDAK